MKLMGAKLKTEWRRSFMRWINNQWDSLPKHAADAEGFCGLKGREHKSWRTTGSWNSSQGITYACTVHSHYKKFAHDHFWQQVTDVDRLGLNQYGQFKDAANKLSSKSKASRAQQSLGFETERLIKNSR